MLLEDLEIKLLTEALYVYYGYDFRGYSEQSFKRRLTALLTKSKVESFSQLQHVLLHQPAAFATAIPDLTVGTSEMFRDPGFFAALRKDVFPLLATYPAFTVWHAGCSTGEEVYSLAIALREANLYDRATIYATDLNVEALRRAKFGRYRSDQLIGIVENYQACGGSSRFESYYQVAHDWLVFDPSLRDNMVFHEHNLVTDEVFAETHLILCRNVLIYFKRDLQNRVLNLFSRSLSYKGFLCLGGNETVAFLNQAADFKTVSPQQPIFQKIVAQGSAPIRYETEVL